MAEPFRSSSDRTTTANDPRAMSTNSPAGDFLATMSKKILKFSLTVLLWIHLCMIK